MEKSLGPRKVLRAPALRRGREIIPISDRVKLERVLGFTLSNNAAFDCDPHSSIVAYPAGCVVVLYNVRKNKQHHILSSSKKTITSLAFSGDGKYLATGECGHQPHVRVWDIQEKNQIAEFQGHKYGINCVAFSPNLKYVVSVGSQHDMIVNVWDWKNNVKVASNKVSCKVKAISFAVNGNYFVTVGNRHVKFWYLEYSRSAKHKLEPVPLMGRSAILGDQRNNNFCDVACGKGEMCDSTYAITKSGLLCEFNSRRLLDKWVELRTSSANSISVRDQYIFIGCASGVIRCFSPFDLNFICTLPKPHYLGIDVAQGVIGSKPVSPHPSNVKYPDTVAIALDESNKKVTCIYNDHSLYVWDIKDMKKIGKSHSFFYHSACIWGIETYPYVSAESEHVIPKGTFLTCSSDDTIRFWNLEPSVAQDAVYHRNIFSSELLKILYIDPELSYLCDMDSTPSGTNDKADATYDGKNGVRCLRISPNGRHLASGDRSGNIRIHDLEFVEEICKVEAHDSEVLCLEYSKPIIVNGEEKKYLASASRDRLIHVFDVKQDYSFQETLDDHSSSITAVRFVHNSGLLQMISCGADKSIIFRKAQFNPHLSFTREHHVVGKTTLYDMEIDIHQRHILTACQDRNIRIYSVLNGKQIRYFRGSQGEDGTLIKVALDPSGTYLATSCTDKSLYIYDYCGGECLATMFGHSELVTGLKFTDDGQHLISVSGDGCIFLWRLPIEITQNIISKVCVVNSSLPNLWQDGRKNVIGITKPVQLLENNVIKTPISNDLVNGNNLLHNESSPGYRFSMGQLPVWAKKQMLEELSTSANKLQLTPPLPPRGRWAQRIDGQGLVMRSYLDSDSVIPYPNISEESENNAICQIIEKIEKTKQIETTKMEGENIHFEVSPHSFQEIMIGDSHQARDGRITVCRDTDSYNNNKKDNRIPESESLQVNNSMISMRVEDMDAEDERSDSEISETVYYPVSEDGSDKGDSNFHVCANNEDAKTQKTIIGAKQDKHFNNTPVISTPEQAETNSDDDDASTPVESDKSFLSCLCVSTENLERLGQREKFMRSNYESLEKDESTELDFDERSLYRQSISAKFLSGSLATAKRPISNSPMGEASSVLDRQTFIQTSKREKLNKALSETKKKLETVGFRTGLSNSKSISDIRNLHDKDSYRISKFGSSDNDIRRATSMTDLSTTVCRRLFSSTNVSQNDKESGETAPLWNQSRTTQDNSLKPWNSSKIQMDAQKSIQLSTSDTPVTMSRSISMSSLHSKHHTSASPIYRTPSVYSLARTSAIRQNSEFPTLGRSFYNSLSSPLRKNNLPSLPPRTQPLSIITTATLATDSSSDSSPTESVTKSSFPTLQNTARRPRFLSTTENIDCKRKLQQSRQKSQSEWDLKSSNNSCSINKNGWPSSQMYHEKLSDEGHSEEHSDNLLNNAFLLIDPTSVPLSVELCEDISENLKKIASYVVQIYQRVTLNSDISNEDKYQMSNVLAQSVWQAQQTLRPTTFPMPLWTTPLDTENHFLAPRRLPGLSLLPNGDHPESSLPKFVSETQMSHPEVIDTMTLLQQFSDKLLSIVEQQISMKHKQQKPNE